MKKIIGIFIVFISFMQTMNAQDKEKYVSFVGQITEIESGAVMPEVTVTNETRNNTVFSKRNGFYSIVAAKGDIIRFSHVGFDPVYMRVNDSAKSKETIMVQMTKSDIAIDEVVVSMPSLDELNDYFMDVDVEADKSRELSEQNPDTFRILDKIEKPAPGGPVSFLKKAVFDKIKKKSRKKHKAKSLPKFKKKKKKK